MTDWRGPHVERGAAGRRGACRRPRRSGRGRSSGSAGSARARPRARATDTESTPCALCQVSVWPSRCGAGMAPSEAQPAQADWGSTSASSAGAPEVLHRSGSFRGPAPADSFAVASGWRGRSHGTVRGPSPAVPMKLSRRASSWPPRWRRRRPRPPSGQDDAPLPEARSPPVRKYIKEGWTTLTRSTPDLVRAAPDPKLHLPPGTPWPVYLSAREDRARVENDARGGAHAGGARADRRCACCRRTRSP